MNRPILIRGARQAITVRGSASPRRGYQMSELGIIQDGSILIQDGVIREIGPTRRVENLAVARAAEEIDAVGRIVMPGFVDPHTHLICASAYRAGSLAEETAADPDTVRVADLLALSRRVQDTSTKVLARKAERTLQLFVEHGTTTLEAKSGCGFTESGELKILRAQTAIASQMATVISTFMPNREPGRESFPCTRELLELIRRRRLAQFLDVELEHSESIVEEGRRCLLLAREVGLLCKVHTGQYSNAGGVVAAIECGAVTLDHLLHADDRDAAILADSRAIAVLMPGPVFLRGSDRFAPARMLIDAGAAVALATDYNVHASPSLSMQAPISLACRFMQMTPAEAIVAATVNGAHAVRLADRTGSLESGKWADIVMLSVSDYREIPRHFGMNLVELTMKRGHVLYVRPEVKCLEL